MCVTVEAETIKLFAIYLESRGYKQQFITSHISATSFVHKLLNIYYYIYFSVREIYGV